MRAMEIDDAAKRGAQVAADWRAGVESLIRVCVGIRSGFAAFGTTKALIDAFLAPLVISGVITADEARLGRSGSKLSMLIQIAEHEELLRRHEIARHLMAGYTLAYQACVLFKNLPGDESQKVEELSRILAACPEDRARQYLLAETRRLKRPRPATVERGNAAEIASDAPTTLRALFDGNHRFDLIALTPGPDELRLLGEYYPDDAAQGEPTLARVLPVHRVIEGNAAIIVATPHRGFPIVANKLLGLCGFNHHSQVLLTRPQSSLDITDVDVIVIAKRGETQLSLSAEAWNGKDGALDPLEVAARIYPDAKHRLLLFAAAQAPGWCCVPANDTWLERPSVQ